MLLFIKNNRKLITMLKMLVDELKLVQYSHTEIKTNCRTLTARLLGILWKSLPLQSKETGKYINWSKFKYRFY